MRVNIELCWWTWCIGIDFGDASACYFFLGPIVIMVEV